jgi:predicted transcriptional regulator
MELPQEIELWYVIPAIRKALVLELKKQGLKQKEIASLLGLTESAISQYVKDKRASFCCDAFRSPVLASEVRASADRVIGARSSDIATREINRICRFIRDNKIICDIHRKHNPKARECKVCYE